MPSDSGCELSELFSDLSSDLSIMNEDVPGESGHADPWLDDSYTPIDDNRDDGSQPPTAGDATLPNEDIAEIVQGGGDDDGSELHTAADAALPIENHAKIDQSEADNDVQRLQRSKAVKEEAARGLETRKKSVEMTRVTWTGRKRVSFSDVGSAGDDSGVEDDYSESGEDVDVKSEADSEEETSQIAIEESGCATEDHEDDGYVETGDQTGRREMFVTASPKMKATSSASFEAPTSQLVAPKSPERLARPKAAAAARVSDDDSELSDPDSNPEDPDGTSTWKEVTAEFQKKINFAQAGAAPEKELVRKASSSTKHNTTTQAESLKKHDLRKKTGTKGTHSKASPTHKTKQTQAEKHDAQKKVRSQHREPKINPPKKINQPPAKRSKSSQGKAMPAVADSEDDVDEIITRTISTAQMRGAIMNLYTTSLQVYHQFVAYASERDGDAAGNAAETAFAGASQINTRSGAQRKRERKKEAKSDAPSRKKPRQK
ncbi:hypothetical protein P171DRAFT_432201 [Karstenula rhodostoma CBS 690.94]|uniref:Uncharacterized protein n=1 Tax=Karstenula rhodostoma CBS 690.94 TaxID=1392251 RepID=A0A9P4UA45_9PLEO|nr:hypothetical protein P171DRAFT_432201 [Karstenula rhodostoma CBS 690.94]